MPVPGTGQQKRKAPANTVDNAPKKALRRGNKARDNKARVSMAGKRQRPKRLPRLALNNKKTSYTINGPRVTPGPFLR